MACVLGHRASDSSVYRSVTSPTSPYRWGVLKYTTSHLNLGIRRLDHIPGVVGYFTLSVWETLGNVTLSVWDNDLFCPLGLSSRPHQNWSHQIGPSSVLRTSRGLRQESCLDGVGGSWSRNEDVGVTSFDESNGPTKSD